MTDPKAEPLTEAKERRLRRVIDAYPDRSLYNVNARELFATLDATRAQLTAATERAQRAEDARDKAEDVLARVEKEKCALDAILVERGDVMHRQQASIVALERMRDAAQRDAKRYREALEKIRDAHGWDREEAPEIANAALARPEPSGGENG